MQTSAIVIFDKPATRQKVLDAAQGKQVVQLKLQEPEHAYGLRGDNVTHPSTGTKSRRDEKHCTVACIGHASWPCAFSAESGCLEELALDCQEIIHSEFLQQPFRHGLHDACLLDIAPETINTSPGTHSDIP